MERLAKLILSVVDLAEVEITSFKRGTVRLCFTIVAVTAGAVLAAIGLVLLLASAYLELEHVIGRVASLALVGGTFLGIGLFLLFSSWKKGASGKPTASNPSDQIKGEADAPPIRIAS